MARWSSRLIRKCIAAVVKTPRNIVTRRHKYAVVGVSGVLAAAVSLGSVNSDDNIVVGARGLLRFVRSVKVGLSISLDYYFAMIGLTEDTPNYDVMMSRIHQRCAEGIRDGCLQNGGTYIKIGQGMVSLSHILPREYIDTLKVLQDKCLDRDKEELYQVFQEDFGKTPEELFDSFDLNPIAAASIAQRVLVTEFIEGIKISDHKGLIEHGFSLVDINNKLFEAFGHQIFQTGFVHADPHPGNIMIRKRNGKAELIILDHGLYQKISNEERIALSHMWKAIVFGNHEQMQKYSKMLGVDDHIMLAEVLTQTPLRGLGFKLKVKLSKEEEKYMKKAAGEKFDQIIACLQQMPRKLLLVVRNLNTIRAISYDHGCPIDRYTVLARMATKAAFEVDSTSLTKKIIAVPTKLWFEIALLISRFITYWRMVFFDILYKFGIAPDIKVLMEQAARNL